MPQGKWSSLALLAGAEVLALSLWFSASAVVPQLRALYGLSYGQASLFTSAVQAGFVVGTLISATLGLADRIDPRRFFMVSTLFAASANALILALDPTSLKVAGLRFLTGMAMAGIYPVGMRLASTWAKGDMGLLVGILVGALTLGSGAPHLLNAAGGIDWRITIAGTSLAALGAAALIRFSRIGPNVAPARPFHPRLALKAWTTPALRLANLGYLGHMWELYAMWAWIVVFLQASFAMTMAPASAGLLAKLTAFFTLAAGALGCLLGGWIADRWGRTTLTMAAMGLSGSCALVAGHFFGGAPAPLILLCLVWGFSIVADSAQFSASIAELSEQSLVGTMLTVQTCLGFLLTLVTIHMIPVLVDAIGWRYAFAGLSLGPFLGVVAMARLRAHPDARKLAGGRR